MLEAIASTLFQIIETLKHNALFLCVILAVLWGIRLINAASHYRLNVSGIYPRTWHGLIGIFFAPFLHGSAQHLFFNSIPLFILGGLILSAGEQVFFKISLVIIVLSGAMVWLFGRRAFHVGASTVVMGYWGFLLFNAYQQQSLMAILLAILCLYYFGSLVFSLFPTEEKVSWEGHLFGVLAGLGASYLQTHNYLSFLNF